MEEEISYPMLFSNQISSVIDIFANYGWYILMFLIVSLYVYEKYLKYAFQQHKKQKDEAEYSAKYHKNPDLMSARLLAQEKRTQELQKRYCKAAVENKKKLEEKEDKKREELMEKYNGSGHVLGSGSSKSFKPDYNPLMGSGSSSGYKPPKKSCCSKRGCN